MTTLERAAERSRSLPGPHFIVWVHFDPRTLKFRIRVKPSRNWQPVAAFMAGERIL